jgi:hypothetical protein
VKLEEAIESMARILHEERQRPTIKYSDNWGDLKAALGGRPIVNSAALALPPYNRPTLTEMRKQHPRLVSEKPEIYTFEGTNYEILTLLFGQLQRADHDAFINKLLAFVSCGGFTAQSAELHFPKFQGRVSDLPLVAEFCIRNGYAEQLFLAAAGVKVPTVALALMMMQLEETIALNFNLFTVQNLKRIETWLGPLRETADAQTHSARGDRGGKMIANPRYKAGREHEANRIVDSIDGITAECNHAIFFYLKGSLEQTRNLEVEGDKIKVESYLKRLGFDPLLQQGLDEAEREFRDEASGFELKTCMGHLRSFLEGLHAQACAAIAKDAFPESEYNRWGLSLAFLRKRQFLSPQEESLVAGIHRVMSEEGVHPLIAEREYVRLLRNMVIEYGLLLMTILDKRNVKISAMN